MSTKLHQSGMTFMAGTLKTEFLSLLYVEKQYEVTMNATTVSPPHTGITIGLTESSKTVSEGSGDVSVCVEVLSGTIVAGASVDFSLSVRAGTAGTYTHIYMYMKNSVM